MLKKIILLLLISVMLFGDQIHWAKNFQSALKESKKENKPVMFVISSHYCDYCLLLDRTTFKDPDVIYYVNKHFVAIRSWIDKGDYVPKQLVQYSRMLPCTWILSSDAKPIYRPLLGYTKASAFEQLLSDILITIKQGN